MNPNSSKISNSPLQFPQLSILNTSIFPSYPMAPKKSSSPSVANVNNLIQGYDILNTITIKSITNEEEKIWRLEGLGVDLHVLGKRHIEVVRFPIPPLVL